MSIRTQIVAGMTRWLETEQDRALLLAWARRERLTIPRGASADIIRAACIAHIVSVEAAR